MGIFVLALSSSPWARTLCFVCLVGECSTSETSLQTLLVKWCKNRTVLLLSSYKLENAEKYPDGIPLACFIFWLVVWLFLYIMA